MSQDKKYLIDGYNLIFTSGKIFLKKGKTLKDARENLVKKISKYIRGKNVKAIVFFDGEKEDLPYWKENWWDVEVIFSKAKSADEEIISYLQNEKVKNCVVVSNDRELGIKCKKTGTELITVKSFLNKTKNKKVKEIKEHKILTKGEIEYWLKIFKR
jgi:predicted RNA-binding protein with PIN domain